MKVARVDFEQADAPEAFCHSLQHTGFAVLENHPIPQDLLDAIYKEWTAYFASPDKTTYYFNRDTQDGFFPQTISETAKGATVKDIKEYFQYYPWGQYPADLSDNTCVLYEKLTELAATLLAWLEQQLPQSIAEQLSMPLSAMIQDSQQTMLRILHYPAFSGNEPPGAVRAAAHEDINLITLLVGATSAGLQVQDKHGNWHEVPCSAQSIAVNVGDMLDLATQRYYQSTTHRVVNPNGDNRARLSMPLFLHPRPEVPLSPDKTAKQYLHERLTELGVI